MLAATLRRHPLQRCAATSDEVLHNYPATHFGVTTPNVKNRTLTNLPSLFKRRYSWIADCQE